MSKIDSPERTTQMTPERWAKIRAYVERAMTLPSDLRSTFLRNECTDPEMIAEAEHLLSYDRQASTIFAIEGWQQRAERTAADASLAGTMLGNYRLLGELGRGGMGTVYLAERADGVYQQKVALKILQENIFTPALAERFRQERQILARLQHPGIARLLDGGVMPDGRPYLVLEFVDGKPIDIYCDEHQLDIDARLRLFLRVAEVVQSAHQQLVLHLDLKPANILVIAEGEPRLLDFGISRILSEAEGGASQTEATLRLLTPRYASPEQATGASLGVASDVFSLATLLYRLLTGSLPYPIDDANPLEAARMICHVSPIIPSQAAPLAIRPQVRGDLDTILLQALRKEPERRYPTIAAFAADVQRYLASEPVLAHADSFKYRAGKFLRRNRAAVIAASIVVIILAGSAVAVVRSAIVARRQRAIAERRLKDVRALAHSYVFDLDPQLEQIPGTVGVRGFILKNALKYLEAISKEATDDDDLSHEIAMGYVKIGRVQAEPSMPSMADRAGAWDSLSKGVAIQRRLFEKHPSNMDDRGWLIYQIRYLEYLATYDGDIVRTNELAHQAWELGQPILAAGPATTRYLDMPQIAWDIATANSGNGDLWNFADPVEALTWLDRMHTITVQYGAKLPEKKSEPFYLGALEREELSRAWVLIQLGRASEAGALYEEALRVNGQMQNLLNEVQFRKVARAEYAGYLASMHRVREADAMASTLMPPEIHEKGNDRAISSDDADTLTILAAIDFQSGRMEAGNRKMKQSLDSFEALYKSDPEDANLSSELAWDMFRLAELTSLDSATRTHLYQRPIEIAKRFAATHPQQLSAALLIGKCELGLANLARDAENEHDQKSHAAASIEQFSKVLAAHPVQPEASSLLKQAKTLATT